MLLYVTPNQSAQDWHEPTKNSTANECMSIPPQNISMETAHVTFNSKEQASHDTH